MAIVHLPTVMPSDLKDQRNGKLGPCSLTSVFFPAVGHLSLHPLAARAWNAAAVVCLAETGGVLSTTGTYRSYDQQVTLFRQRYTSSFDPTVNAVPPMSRTWEGVLYFLRKGMAPAASPGTSNHGWGLAVDAAVLTNGKIAGITTDAKVWTWAQDELETFGWSWEGAKPGQRGWEPWHWKYVAGDAVPQRVLDVEAFLTAAGNRP